MSFQRKSNIAIILIAFLIIGNQSFIEYWLLEKKYDAKIINVSGKQRMLSQRILALTLDYQITKVANKIVPIKTLFKEWEAAHQDLINGNESRLLKKVSQKTKQELEQLTPHIEFTKTLLNDIGQLSNEDLSKFQENQTQFLVKMNEIVETIELESNSKFRTMTIVQFLFSLIVIGVIIFELKFVFQPITERLNRQNKALKNSNKTLEEYAYIASHDLRSPLQNILSFLGLLKKTAVPKLDEKEKVYFKFVEESADRMNQTTVDLLHYSTSNDVNIETVKTAAVFQAVLDDIQTIINDKKAIINISNLPDEIKVDENLFRLLLQNLITNALKFIPKEERPKVDISCQSNKNQYVFCVRDNGIGISKENLGKIFKIFKRLHSQKEYEGTGIGLSMCRRIIEGHQGEIWVESEVGKGSQFYFSIPK